MRFDTAHIANQQQGLTRRVADGRKELNGMQNLGIYRFTWEFYGIFMSWVCDQQTLGGCKCGPESKTTPKGLFSPPSSHRENQGLLHLEALLKFQIIRRDAPGVAQGAHRHLQQKRHQQTWFKDRCHVVPQPNNMVCCFLNDHDLMKK